jgi:hypothetical protein
LCDFSINRKEDVANNLKNREASGKLKNQPRLLLRPSSVNFGQNFRNLSHESVPLTAIVVVQAREAREKDADRRDKTRSLFSGLSSQEGEYKQFLRSKKKF